VAAESARKIEIGQKIQHRIAHALFPPAMARSWRSRFIHAGGKAVRKRK